MNDVEIKSISRMRLSLFENHLLCIEPCQPRLPILFFQNYKWSAIFIEGNTLWTSLKRHCSHLCEYKEARIPYGFYD